MESINCLDAKKYFDLKEKTIEKEKITYEINEIVNTFGKLCKIIDLNDRIDILYSLLNDKLRDLY